VLAFALNRTAGAAYSVVEAPQLALCARIHIAQTCHHRMGLVIQVQCIYDQFFEVDVRGKVAESLWSWASTISTAISTTQRRPRALRPVSL